MVRPKSIANFEYLYLLAILVEVVHIALQWPLLSGDGTALATRMISVALTLGLVWLTARRRNKIARILLTLVFVAALPMAAYIFQPGVPIASVIITATQVLLQAGALVLLFTPASRAWFEQGDGPAAA